MQRVDPNLEQYLSSLLMSQMIPVGSLGPVGCMHQKQMCPTKQFKGPPPGFTMRMAKMTQAPEPVPVPIPTPMPTSVPTPVPTKALKKDSAKVSDFTKVRKQKRLLKKNQAFFSDTPKPFQLNDIRTNISEYQDRFVYRCELPGFCREDVTMSIVGDFMSISAEKKQEVKKEDKKDDKKEKKEEKKEEERIISKDFSCGKVERKFKLKSCCDKTSIGAKMDCGLLTVTVKKVQLVVPPVTKVIIE